MTRDGNGEAEPAEAVHLPARVVDRIERRLPDTRFDSVDEYATVALELLLREIEQRSDEPAARAGEPADETAVESDEAIERQLESLGYL